MDDVGLDDAEQVLDDGAQLLPCAPISVVSPFRRCGTTASCQYGSTRSSVVFRLSVSGMAKPR
jgi:hypothetical protein